MNEKGRRRALMFMQEVTPHPPISRMMAPLTQEASRMTFNLSACAAPRCGCPRYEVGNDDAGSCDCGHSWVTHAIRKLWPRPPSNRGPVEAVLPGPVLDLSSLVLYGTQALPVRLKILLDRLYSVLTPQQVAHILRSLGWTLADYVRGYKLQRADGKALERWSMVSPEEETLLLKEFLRFGETRPVVEFMAAVHHPSCTERHEGLGEEGSSVHWIRPSTMMDRVTWDWDTQDPECDLLRRRGTAQENTSSFVLSNSSSSRNLCKTSSSCVRPLPSFSSAFQDRPAPPSSCHPVPKGRVLCGVCGKSFYDKGTLKIHYNAVHLKIKHGCTVAGCTMVFSSLRSRNRHSANPNPRLHRSGTKDVPDARTAYNSSPTSKGASRVGSPACVSLHNAPVSVPVCQSSPCDSKSAEAGASFPTNQQQLCESRDSIPKKKPRKSSMPLKVECRTFQ
uniref:zinc finger protein basonuclin-2 isoform X2 n=1 Tax=Doryrhamphus excisus TaxID=161450 RepID=UPI0025ADF87B|nr:zinc finger protein basonuclin-2 isoform X2 [Doryrhamphus excisus]